MANARLRKLLDEQRSHFKYATKMANGLESDIQMLVDEYGITEAPMGVTDDCIKIIANAKAISLKKSSAKTLEPRLDFTFIACDHG